MTKLVGDGPVGDGPVGDQTHGAPSPFPIYALGVAHTNDHAAPEDFVETSSGLLLVYAAGAVAGPFFASLVTGAFGPGTLYAYVAGVHGVLMAFVIWRMTQQASVPDAEHVKFTEALRAATTVSSVFDALTQAELEATRLDKAAAPVSSVAPNQDSTPAP